jgi:uroporphyrinogen decarboxylase
MTRRELFINALEGGPPVGRVPHFELVFFLTMEAFGRVHPLHRNYAQWDQMTRTEQELHLRDVADLYITTARKYEHSAVFLHGGFPTSDDDRRLIDEVRRQSGDEFFLMMHGDSTYGIPTGEDMMEFCGRLMDDPQAAQDQARRQNDEYLERGEKFRKHGGLDGFALCSDYCFNTGPFFSPDWFDHFVTPYLADLIRGYREQSFYVIKHTDGNIMPILDRLLVGEPHALHSIDPQGDVDIAEVKRLVGDRVCLIGNVNCGLLDTGTEAECLESARYALEHGMPGGRYIFSTSNCIYTGMRLERYELILDVWRELGTYPDPA